MTARGVLARITGRVRRVAERTLDRRYGVTTSKHVYLEDLGLGTENRVWHDPSDWVAARRALARLKITSEDVFVDYGSGLGRAVLVAASFPFRRVIGVELSDELTGQARENLARNAHRVRAAGVELVTADALEWAIPRDLTVAYLYCPFTGSVFDRVVAKLFESVDEHPRALRMLYNYPLEHTRLIQTGRVRVLEVASSVWLGRSRRSPDVIVTYLILPSDEALAREYAARYPQRVSGAEQWLGEYEPGYVLEKPARLGGVVVDRRQ